MAPVWIDFVVSGLAQDCAGLEADHLDAVAEAATYRQLLDVALELLAAEKKRADAATKRLRQVMGGEAWHREETADVPS